MTGYDAFVAIGSEDIRMAADALRGVYDSTNAHDGYVSFEAQAGTPRRWSTRRSACGARSAGPT